LHRAPAARGELTIQQHPPRAGKRGARGPDDATPTEESDAGGRGLGDDAPGRHEKGVIEAFGASTAAQGEVGRLADTAEVRLRSHELGCANSNGLGRLWPRSVNRHHDVERRGAVGAVHLDTHGGVVHCATHRGTHVVDRAVAVESGTEELVRRVREPIEMQAQAADGSSAHLEGREVPRIRHEVCSEFRGRGRVAVDLDPNHPAPSRHCRDGSELM
jgi:hypothetical protein